LRRVRLLPVLLCVTVVANMVNGAVFEVALPDLAHMKFGAAGYGALVTVLGAGGVTGPVAAATVRAARRPAMTAFGCFLTAAVALAGIPYLYGLPGAAAMLFIFGASLGFGNAAMVTLLQQWAPPELLGRIMSLFMLASMGTFPVSVAVSGLLVRHVGVAPFFPAAGLMLALAILGAVSSRQVRSFGQAGAPPERSRHVAADEAGEARAQQHSSENQRHG
jgi:hypothetical protein